MSAPGPSAPSLVDLAHAAERRIEALCVEQDYAARTVGSGMVWSADGHSLSIFHTIAALTALRAGFAVGSVPRELDDIADRVARGIVRPEWGLRVVAIASAEQERRKAAANG